MGMRIASATLALVVLVGAAPAPGAVYCRKTKGSKPVKPIVLRDGACKANESDVTAEVVAAVRGPKGDQGDPGPVGPQGPPAAGGLVNMTPAMALAESPAFYTVGGGPNVSGIYMPNSSFNRFHTGFTLPPDYTAGTDVTLRIMWANGNANAVDCGFVLWANGAIAYRPGTTAFAYIASGRFSNASDTITLAAGSTPQAVRVENLTIPGAGGGGGLQPGDALQIAVARRADDAPDTCTGSLVVVGLDATYQPAQ